MLVRLGFSVLVIRRLEYDQRPIERILAKAGSRKGGQAMRAAAKIYRARRQHNPHTGRDRDQALAARTARSTAVSVLVSTPVATLTLTPPTSISISGVHAVSFADSEIIARTIPI